MTRLVRGQDAADTKEASGPQPHAGSTRERLKKDRSGKKSKPSTRDRILEHLKRHPGATATQIASALDCKHQNISRHLRILQRDHKVSSEKEGRDRHFYLSHQTGIDVRIRPQLEDPRRFRIARTLAEDTTHAWTINRLAKQCGTHFDLTRRFLRTLDKRGLVSIEKVTSTHVVRPTTRLQQVLDLHEAHATSPRDTVPKDTSPEG